MNFIVLGFQIAILITGGVLGGIGLGYLADQYLGIFPWGIIIGVIIGVIVGWVGVVHIINAKGKK